VPCDWDPDCDKGLYCALLPYQYLPVCSLASASCNATVEAVSGKDYENGILTYVSSINRCYNINCMKNSECAGDLPCWNSSFCGGPSCNDTLEYIFFNETTD
jgi:hypothetical protein